jgi:DNA-binding PadR family transcriptional regulator
MRYVVGGRSNWETILYYLINKTAKVKGPYIYRTELMKMENLELARQLSEPFGHKKDPKAIEQTLQKTLQNMRDKGNIEFLGQGEYRLTEEGLNRMRESEAEMKKKLGPILELMEETIKTRGKHQG